MPELAEVYYYAHRWGPGLGKKIKEVETGRPSRVWREPAALETAASLQGTTLRQIHTHGKQILFEFSQDRWLWAHLGMTGSLFTQTPTDIPAKHEHLRLHYQGGVLAFTDPRQFGALHCERSRGAPTRWLSLPPQPMQEAFTLDRLQAYLKRHPRTAIKALLLDQAMFPGIGNWMADEVLWQMQVPPAATPASLTVAQQRLLHTTLGKVCRTALATIGTDWTDPPPDWLFRYRWTKGLSCPRCGTSLQRATLRGRTACWCPHCQPEGNSPPVEK